MGKTYTTCGTPDYFSPEVRKTANWGFWDFWDGGRHPVPYAPCMLYIFDIYHKSKPNVGQYSSPMDPMCVSVWVETIAVPTTVFHGLQPWGMKK